MKNNLGKFLAIGSLVAGGSLVFAMPANALKISFSEGDFFNVNTHGALFTGEEFTIPSGPFAGTYNSDGAVISNVQFDDDRGLGTSYILPNGQARADLGTTNIAEILADPDYTAPGGNEDIVLIRSADFNNPAWFTPTTPGGPDVVFDPIVSNSFDVVQGPGGFGDFVVIDGTPGDDEDPDIIVRLLNLTTSQSASLLSTDAEIGVGFTGDVAYITTGEMGEEIRLGTGSFSTTFPANGTSSADGTAVLSFTVEGVDIPESSPVSALIGLGLFGSAFALKKKIRLG